MGMKELTISNDCLRYDQGPYENRGITEHPKECKMVNKMAIVMFQQHGTKHLEAGTPLEP